MYFGDFNFPNISWREGNVYSPGKEEREKSEENKQAETLIEFTRENFMENIILTPTRGANILDLVFTNNPNLINFYTTIVNNKLSDHNTLEINMNFSYNQEVKEEKVANPYYTKIFEYDTANADEEDWERFKQYIEEVDAESEFEKLKPNEILKKIYTILEKAADICLKKKKEFEEDKEGVQKKRSFIPSKVRKLMRKKEKLSKKVMASKAWTKNYDTMMKLIEVETKLDEMYKSRRKKKENEAINKMTTNPSYFYSYAKRFSKTSNQIGQLTKKDGTIVTDSSEKAELLKEQYESVSSKPRENFKIVDPTTFFEIEDSGNETDDEPTQSEAETTEDMPSLDETDVEPTQSEAEAPDETDDESTQSEAEPTEDMPRLDGTDDEPTQSAAAAEPTEDRSSLDETDDEPTKPEAEPTEDVPSLDDTVDEDEYEDQSTTECGQCVASEVHECWGDQEQEQDMILQSEEQEQDVILQSEYNDTATPTTTLPPTLVGEGVGEEEEDEEEPSEQVEPDEPNQQAEPPPLTDVHFDWMDFVEAIEAIPNGSSPGPDGIPAVMIKKAKVPIGRMLCYFFRISVDQGHIPEVLKQAFVIPVYKQGGSKVEPEAYRPISLTSHLMKSGERVIRKIMVNYLEFHKKMDPKQHGSRKNRSTLSQLLVHYENIVKALENGENIDVIYLDFKRAFDKVDFGILLHKIKQMGITGKIGRWIHNFLTMRNQQVLIRGKKSQMYPLISGVPQGSVLGPLLFLIFISDLAEGVEAETLVYVDDSKVTKRVNNEKEVETVQKDLETIYNWQKQNNMEFNSKKFQVLRYGKDGNLKETTEYFTAEMDSIIEQVESCKDLGVIMTDNANFEDQTQKACSKARQQSGWIMRTFYSRRPTFMKHMYNTLVQAHLDYCVQLWAPPEGPLMDKVENVLRNYTKQIPTMRNMNYWERLKSLKMNSEIRRIERYKILYTWKVLQQIVPNPGIDLLPLNENRGRMCHVPFTRNEKRMATFQISGAKLFNSLPKEIRDIQKGGIEDFKLILDAFLTTIPDEPRCPDLTPGATDRLESKPSNSLLHQIPRAWREGLPNGWMNQLAS